MAILDYGDMKTRSKATHLTKAVTVWEDAENSVTWALALHTASTPLVEPQLRNRAWRCLGVLPPGIPVEELGNERERDFVRCRLAGAEVSCSVEALWK